MMVFAAFINGTTFLIMSIEIFLKAMNRFVHPESLIALPMLIMAGVGLTANPLVVRVAFLRVIEDAQSSVGSLIHWVNDPLYRRDAGGPDRKTPHRHYHLLRIIQSTQRGWLPLQ